MDAMTLHRLIGEHLDRLSDLHHSMQTHTGNIPSVEIDRFLAELRGTYELGLTLYHRNALRTMEDLEAAIGNRYLAETGPLREIEQRAIERKLESFGKAKEPATDPATAAVNSPVQADTTDSVATENLTPSTTDHILIDAMNRVEEAQARTVRDLHEQFEEPTTLADRFEEPTTLAERIAPVQGSARIAERMQKKPIRDLKAAIGINERFLFINHLFAGDSGEYHKAIETVNTAPNIEAAKKFVQEQLIARYQWNLSGDPADAFMDLLERRFLA